MMHENTFLGCSVTDDLTVLKEQATIIVANRFDTQLLDVSDKVYIRDLHGRDWEI